MDLSFNLLGHRWKNPFALASGNLATNAATTLAALEQGMAAVVYKTVTLDQFRTVNVGNRFAEFPIGVPHSQAMARQNIEGISEHTLAKNLEEFEKIRSDMPSDALLIISIMAPADLHDAWAEVFERVAPYAHIIEGNNGCPQDASERGMGSAVGRDVALLARVTDWTTELSKKFGVPVIHKLTVNDCNPRETGAAALMHGAHGLTAINTVLGITGIDRRTHAPVPTVCGKTVAGGMSGDAIRPIALRVCAHLAKDMRDAGFEDRALIGVGGISTGYNAVEFMRLGCDAVQMLTGLWNHPDRYKHFPRILDDFVASMDELGVSSVSALKGTALDLITTHQELLSLEGRQRVDTRTTFEA